MLAPFAAMLMLIGLIPAGVAQAAGGPAVLDVAISAVDYGTGAPQTTAAFGTHGDRVAYRVSYSCAVAACEGATIQLTPSQADPYGLAAQATRVGKTLLEYESVTVSSGAGVAVSGDDQTGKLISLGDLAAGSSGSILVVYMIQSTGTYATPRAAQFYPSGFQIVMGSTIDSTNSQAAITKQAGAVVWSSQVPEPAVGHSNPNTVKPGVDVSYSLYMGSGSFPRRDGSSITGTSQWAAAGNYTVVEHLPTEAVYVSSTGGGIYDPIDHTVTWTGASQAEPDYFAAGGWGYHSGSGWAARDGYGGRRVTVNYPTSAFADADVDGCNFTASVSSMLETSVTYLDTARTTKTASTSISHDVSCYDPFGRATSSKDTTNNGGAMSMRNQYVPPVGSAPNARYWAIYANNGGNVPAVATIVDNTLDLADAPVWAIRTSANATIEWTRSDGVSGTTFGASVNAPDGTRFTSVNVISTPIAPSNVRPEDDRWVGFYVRFHYTVASDAPIGETRTNTAQATISYPDNPEIADFVMDPVSSSMRFIATPTATPRITASFPAPAVVEGVGNAVPGSNVTFSVNGTTQNVPAGIDITPQYVFIAPTGWAITQGSEAFAGTVPAGVSYSYSTRTIAGVERQIVVASWPDTVTFGANETWPTMTVVAQPTSAVTAGTTSVATAWVGDSRHNWTNAEARFDGAVQDVDDFDADLDSSEWFASASQSVFVSSADGLTVIKEICQEDSSAADGCNWVSDPDVVVPVSTTATDIRYRVTITNTGNTALANIVAYDVLPHIGDMGTSEGTAGVARGSTFAEILNSVDNVSGLVTLEYSGSTNPCRDEVYPGAPGCVNDWGATANGAVAVRASLPASLIAGGSASFEYMATVQAGANADAVACNSIAISSDQTLAAEPRPVCAATMEADLEISVPDRLPLQQGRPGVLPFTVTNHGGSQSAPAVVTVEIPAGITVSNLEPAGWLCATALAGGPLEGPVALECQAVETDGSERTIEVGTPDTLDVPVVPSAVFSALCTDASVGSSMYDPELANNDTSGCITVLAGTAGVGIDKDDERDAVSIGEEYSYTITVSNLLAGETLNGSVVTDTLPAGLEFVSASGGGTVSGQGADDGYGNSPGGVVTWNLADLAPAGTPTGGGDSGSGAAGSFVELSVTVRVLPGATGAIVNTAEVTAPDPADTASALEADDDDTDQLFKLAVSKTSTGAAAGVRVGDQIDYLITVENVGTADFAAPRLTSVVDDLSGVLDDADFVSGSAWISIDGTAPVALADAIGDQLSWFGELLAGQTAIIGYSVEIVDGSGDKIVRNVVYGAEPPTSCDPVTGLDASGKECATTSSAFAPTVAKSVVSMNQNDDGTWTIVYGIDVVNPNATTDAGYDLADTLAFGTGIDVGSALVSLAPVGVTPEPWSGSGDIALAVVLPQGATHHYELTVVADSNAVTGTAAASCVPAIAGGFANVATLTLADGTSDDAEACAAPVEPTIAKSVIGAPTQNLDGTWTVSYLLTVTNPYPAPDAGLAYTLDDSLSFPVGVDVRAVSVTAPAGITANAGFTGGLVTIDGSAVTADSSVIDGVARIPAGSAATPQVQEFQVDVTLVVTEGSVDAVDVVCGAPGTGYGNWVTLFAGDSSTALGEATACADISLPELRFTKSVDRAGQVAAGTTLAYTITAVNVGDAAFTAADPARFVDDMSGLLDDAAYNDDAAVADGVLSYSRPVLDWSGPIAAGDSVTIRYTATLHADARGDRDAVNVVARSAAAIPLAGAVDCVADAASSTEDACAVSLAVVAPSLVLTGASGAQVLSLAGALALLLGSVLLVLGSKKRRRWLVATA